MIRNLKALGVAVMAVLALGAVAAGSASAEFHSEVAHTTFSGAQEGTHTFTTDPGTVHCKKATFSGTSEKATTNDVTVTFKYEECTLTSIFGNIAVTVSPNECVYTFTTDGIVHVNCPAGKNIVVSGPGCTINVNAGQTLTGNTYTNIGTGTTREVLVHTAAHSIAYSYSGFTCGSGSGTANGTYNGTTKITGTDTNGNHVGIWHQI